MKSAAYLVALLFAVVVEIGATCSLAYRDPLPLPEPPASAAPPPRDVRLPARDPERSREVLFPDAAQKRRVTSYATLGDSSAAARELTAIRKVLEKLVGIAEQQDARLDQLESWAKHIGDFPYDDAAKAPAFPQ